VASGGIALAEDAVDPTAVKSEDGKYLDKEDNPTFKIAADGTVDWYTYSDIAVIIRSATFSMAPTARDRPRRSTICSRR
jgi:hypothetical protein